MKDHKILKNASWIIGCRIAQSILSFLVTLLTARYLGPSNYGLISYAMAIATFVTPIARLGLGNILVQELVNNEDREGTILGTTLILNLFSAFFCVLGIISFSLIANANEIETTIVCALYSIILFFQAAELLQYWFQAKYIAKYYSITALIAFVITTAYRIFLLVQNYSVYFFAVANAFDYFLITVILLIVYWKLHGQKLKFSFIIAKQLVSKSKHYIIADLMVSLFTQTDRIMLKQMLGNDASGIYSAAIACSNLANFVYTAIISSFRPLIFSEYKISKFRFHNSIKQLYTIVIYLSLLECIFITVFAKPIILLLYGTEYAGAVQPLRISIWLCLFSYIGTVRNVWILAENKQKYLWIINLSGALGNIALNFLLIPKLGAIGAAIASVFTQFLANFIISYIIPDIRPSIKLMIQSLNPKYLIQLIKRKEK